MNISQFKKNTSNTISAIKIILTVKSQDICPCKGMAKWNTKLSLNADSQGR